MPVTLLVPVVPAVQTFDKVHLENLVISIEQTIYAKAALRARMRLYYVEANGDKVFSPDFSDISIEDAEKWAVDAAMTGDMRGVEAVGNIKALVALLVETNTNLGETSVS